MRTRVKICGFTRVEDAVTAAFLGVDALGLVFYPRSPRHVSVEQAQKITEALPAFVSVVGLFVDEQEQRINDVLQQVSIDVVQFHGNENGAFCRKFGKPYIKAIRVQGQLDFTALRTEYYDSTGLLLDAYHPNTHGGTGESFDWDLIPDSGSEPIILAGGLGPENAQKAVNKVKPYAVDVSSGVELDKGIKDAAKMAAFIKEVYEGDRKK